MNRSLGWVQGLIAVLLGLAVTGVALASGMDWRYAEPVAALLPGDAMDATATMPPTPSATTTTSSPATTPTALDLEQAQSLYSLYCAVCHGPQGEGTAAAPALNTERIQTMDPEALYRLIAEGVPRTAMQAWLGPLREDEIWALVALLQQGIALNLADITPTPSPAADPLTLGAQLYAQYCASCHGVQGEGTRRAPALNTTAVVTMPSEDLYRIIAEGTPNGMPGWATVLDETGIQALVTYIQSWEGDTSPTTPQRGGPRRGRGRGPWWARPTPTP
ncbi:MAG: c-type cytochrome [Chloroflexi bacterium]|nr:c-type cytochrome [Chloroflexota bacterium]